MRLLQSAFLGTLVALAACAPRGVVQQPAAAAAPVTAHADGSAGTPAPAGALERELRELTRGFAGDVGIYVRHLTNGQVVALAADDTFPTASMVKLPLLVTLYQRAADGAFSMDSAVALTDSTVLQSDGEDLVAQLKWGERVHLRKLAFLMMSTSDNTASVWIQGLVGGADSTNAWLERNGYQVTRNNSRAAHRREIWRRWGWGMTSPREIAELLVQVREGRAVSRPASEAMYRLMKGAYWHDEALAGIPPWAGAASKQGAVNRSRSEVLLVESPGGPYVLSVITKNQEDQSWGADNAGYVLLRRASWAAWRHFNPGEAWRPDWER